MKLKEIAQKINAKLIGDGELEINWVGSFANAGPDQITFITNEKYLEKAKQSKAGAFVISNENWAVSKPALVVADAYRGFVAVENLFLAMQKQEWGIHPTAVIGKNVKLGDPVYIGPYVVIEDGAELGARTRIDALCFIGRDCRIGADTHFYPGVKFQERCVAGSRCIFNAGVVVGGQGFGFLMGKDGHEKIPQLGIAEIGDDVELGALCMIDRASLDKTTIGNGTKFDNCVHIAHSCQVGKNVIILAQTGFGGSVTVGDNATISGHVVVRDHCKIGAGVTIVGGSAVMSDIAPNQTVAGYPTMPFDTATKVYFNMHKLPDWWNRTEVLEQKVKALEEKAK